MSESAVFDSACEAMERSELISLLNNLFRTQKLAVLATCGDVQPHTNLVAYSSTEDLRHLIFATDRSTRKYLSIRENPRVSFLVDSRTNREEDFSEAIAVTAFGEASETFDEDRDRCAGLLLGKHPALKEFVLQQSTAVFSVRVERYQIVRRFQNVVEFDPEI